MLERGRAAALRIGLLAVILALLALALNVTALHAQDETGGGVISFVRLVNGEAGGEGIYLINVDGSGETLLASFDALGYPYNLDDGGYRCPVWSPDGAQLAFNAALDGRSVLVVVDADGSNPRTVYQVENDDALTRQIHFPRWVPGTDRLSFTFTDADPNTGNLIANGVRTVRLDGSDLQTIRDDITLTYPTGEPVQINSLTPNFMTLTHAWSPDGQQLAIASYNDRVYLTDPTGATLRELESSAWAAGGVDWSPDGARIASSLFYVASYTPDDTDLQPIVPMPTDMLDEFIESVAWSPDGRQIAYTSYVTDINNGDTPWHLRLAVVDVATGEEREIVRTPDFGRGGYTWNIACVDWRPDGAPASAEPTKAEAAALSFTTNTPPPTAVIPTDVPVTCVLNAPQNVNLRAEPSTTASVSGSVPRGGTIEVDGRTDADGYRWYHLSGGNWVRGDVVTVDEAACADLPARTHTGGLAG